MIIMLAESLMLVREFICILFSGCVIFDDITLWLRYKQAAFHIIAGKTPVVH